jgi:hypothetical protein
MNEQSNLVHPVTNYPQKGRNNCLIVGVTLGSVIILLLGLCITTYFYRSGFASGSDSLQTLRADANTLYLANWSRDLDHWSKGSQESQWEWEKPGVIDTHGTFSGSPSPLLLAPYQPNSRDIEVDAVIQDHVGFNEFENFGIVTGIDSQGNGYFSGEDFDREQFIERLSSGEDLHVMTQNTGGHSVEDTAEKYYLFTVKIQGNVITLFIDGWQVSQATLSDYHPGGSIGLYASGDGEIAVVGFRVEKLP